MELLLFVFIILFLILLKKHIQLKQQICNLSDQMEALTSGESEKMLDISFVDHDLEHLAGILNRYNHRQRQIVSDTLRHEEDLKEFVANLSHDLRTPLTVILGHLQLLKKENLQQEQENRVKTILNKTERMRELVEAFYDLSALDDKKRKPHIKIFNFSNLLMNLITEHSPVLEHKDIRLEINLPECSVFVCSDQNMVERILQNLLTNAIRYSDGAIKIDLEQPGKDHILFSIKNSVCNLTESDASRLFERFYMPDHSRHSGGTGLGLAVVKTLTEKLGGSIDARLQADSLLITLEL